MRFNFSHDLACYRLTQLESSRLRSTHPVLIHPNHVLAPTDLSSIHFQTVEAFQIRVRTSGIVRLIGRIFHISRTYRVRKKARLECAEDGSALYGMDPHDGGLMGVRKRSLFHAVLKSWGFVVAAAQRPRRREREKGEYTKQCSKI